MKNKLDGKALGLNIKLLTVRLAFLFEIKLLQLKKLPKASKAQTQKKKIAKLGKSILIIICRDEVLFVCFALRYLF